MRNKKTVWLLLVFFLVALLGTMGWVSHILLDVDRDERDDNRTAALQQNARLALWRMESRLNVLLSSLPILPKWATEGETPLVVAEFRIDRINDTSDVRPSGAVVPDLEAVDAILNSNPTFDTNFNDEPDEQRERNRLEALARYKLYRHTKARLGWYNDSVILVGETITGQVIGWVLDWPRLKALLVSDCLPLIAEPELIPMSPGAVRDPDTDLTTMPLRLDAGENPDYFYERLNSPARLMLLVAWSCIFLPAAGLAVLLFASYSLNERRDAFVSAVTHELRTPLTTFSMYTEMLEGDMVPDDKRELYLSTLRREAVRLSHLVENVLAYARIERGKQSGTIERLPIRAELERLRPQLEERCQRAGMTLVYECQPTDAEVNLDASGLERIILNLVDNACKYAVTASDKRVHLTLAALPKHVTVEVRDHGPGVDSSVRKKLFKPFSKSDRDAAGKVPGVGLGLALCRQLSQIMGGTLVHDDSVDEGARFILTLPR